MKHVIFVAAVLKESEGQFEIPQGLQHYWNNQ